MMNSLGVVCSVGVGAARGGRLRNEDNFLVCGQGKIAYLDGEREVSLPGGGSGTLLAVCDGMGGGDDGSMASKAAVRVMAKLYRPGLPRDPARALLRYIRRSHDRLHLRARDADGLVKVGTTLTVAWLLEGHVHWGQVGDSRLYLFRDGQLRALTPMQTHNEFARRDGLPTTRQGEQTAQKFIVGSRGQGDNAVLRLEKGLDTGSVSLQSGDRLLMCTDGLSGVVDEVSIGDVLKNTPDPQAAAVACMERAIARGSTDNITVMVVRVDAQLGHSESTELWDTDDEPSLTY